MLPGRFQLRLKRFVRVFDQTLDQVEDDEPKAKMTSSINSAYSRSDILPSSIPALRADHLPCK